MMGASVGMGVSEDCEGRGIGRGDRLKEGARMG